MFISLSNETFKHSRKVYSLLDLFGDLGGLLEVLMIICSNLIAPWAAFKFNFKAIQKLYYVFTRQRQLFDPTSSAKHLVKKMKMSQAVAGLEGAQESKRVDNIYFSKLSICK